MLNPSDDRSRVVSWARYNGCVDPYPLEVVDEMFELGVGMRRERARRESPELDDLAIESIVDAWLISRPGAPSGDSAGTATTWPRR